MDRISQLSDDLLIKILSLLPTKDVVAMSTLSKRWRSLWTLVPRLVFGDDDHADEDAKKTSEIIITRIFLRLVYGALLLHKETVLERFRLNRVSALQCGSFEIDLWVRIAVDRFLRDLKLSFDDFYCPIRLPSMLFRCETLEALELRKVTLLEVPSKFSFRSLKRLRLLFVKYADEESFVRLISNCPVLKDLVVETCHGDNVATFEVNVASLESLAIRHTLQDFETDDDVFVVHCHSLKKLTIVDYFSYIQFIGGDTPKLVEGNLLSLSCHAKVLASFPRIRRLSLCLDGEARYPSCIVLFELMLLELCLCESNWTYMLASVLQHCPKLQVLKLALVLKLIYLKSMFFRFRLFAAFKSLMTLFYNHLIRRTICRARIAWFVGMNRVVCLNVVVSSQDF